MVKSLKDFGENLKLTVHRLAKCHRSPITKTFFGTFLELSSTRLAFLKFKFHQNPLRFRSKSFEMLIIIVYDFDKIL